MFDFKTNIWEIPVSCYCVIINHAFKQDHIYYLALLKSSKPVFLKQYLKESNI